MEVNDYKDINEWFRDAYYHWYKQAQDSFELIEELNALIKELDSKLEKAYEERVNAYHSREFVRMALRFRIIKS